MSQRVWLPEHELRAQLVAELGLDRLRVSERQAALRDLAGRQRQRGFLLNPYRFGNANAIAIYNGILAGGKGAYWEMEENGAGTQFLDSSGNGNHLTIRQGASIVASSTVSSASGLIGRGFNTNASQRTAYIPRANTNLDLPNTDLSYFGWHAYGASGGSARYVWCRLGAFSAAKYQAALWIDSSNSHIKFDASTDGNTAATVVDSLATASGSGNYWFTAATLERANNLLRIRIKGTGVDVNVTGAFAGALFTTANNANFCINHLLNNDNTFSVAGTRENAGLADQCGYMAGHAMTESEFLYLYNSAAGKTWAQIAADAGH